jgi:hypothetical protein
MQVVVLNILYYHFLVFVLSFDTLRGPRHFSGFSLGCPNVDCEN